MPRRFERHKRGTQYWDAQPARSDEVREAAQADPQPAKRAPGRKDTRRWCHGKEGVEHVLHLVLVQDTPAEREHGCRWIAGWSLRERTWTAQWRCGHREICKGCGRVFREHWELRRDECPAYPGSEAERLEAEAEAKRWREHEPKRRWPRRPLITGPQGYRRKRGA